MSEEEAKLAEWLRGAQQQQEAAREQRMKEKGMLPFVQLETGDNKLKLVRKIPMSPEKNRFGRAGVYVKQSKEERVWTVNPNSPVYSQIIEFLAKGTEDIIVTKTGSGKNTRYDVRPDK